MNILIKSFQVKSSITHHEKLILFILTFKTAEKYNNESVNFEKKKKMFENFNWFLSSLFEHFASIIVAFDLVYMSACAIKYILMAVEHCCQCS